MSRSLSSEGSVNRRMNRKMNLSFAGCGFLGIYHVGVAVCFKKYAPHLLLNRISGASAGGIAACFLLCDLPISAITSDVLNLVCLARKRTLGPFSPSFNVQDVLSEGLRKNLPEDAHLKVSGKLHISLTRLPGFKNVIVSKFYSKEELIQALLASAFVPFFSGSHPPKFHGVYYMDGGFSNNLVTLDENTITVSPFCGETDICPRDTSSQLFHVNLANTSIEVSKQNIYRFARILYPPNPEVLTKLCMQGFHDALRFLQANNLIKCARYIAVESTFLISAKYEDEDEAEHDPECQDCLAQREEAQSATLPESIAQVFHEATEATTKGLINWLYQYRGMKILSVLMLPYTLPFEIAYAAFSKLFMPKSFLQFCEFVMDQLEHFLNIKGEPSTDCVACTCQLTDASYCGMGSTKETVPDTALHAKNTNYPVATDKDHEYDKGKGIHRRPSLNMGSKCEIIADDTFENILEVTAHHEALMTFYYMDDNDKMKVTEIFEVTEAEAQKLSENKDSQVDLIGWLEHQEQQIQSDADQEDAPVFSDPESDWTSPSDSSLEDDSRPESDQRTRKLHKTRV